MFLLFIVQWILTAPLSKMDKTCLCPPVSLGFQKHAMHFLSTSQTINKFIHSLHIFSTLHQHYPQHIKHNVSHVSFQQHNVPRYTANIRRVWSRAQHQSHRTLPPLLEPPLPQALHFPNHLHQSNFGTGALHPMLPPRRAQHHQGIRDPERAV